MSVNTIDQQALKSGIIQLFEEDKAFLHKIVSLFQAEEQPQKKELPQDVNGEDEPKFEKSPLKMNDEEHAEFMKYVKKKYAIKWEDLEPLKELFEDEERSAEELVKML